MYTFNINAQQLAFIVVITSTNLCVINSVTLTDSLKTKLEVMAVIFSEGEGFYSFLTLALLP